MSFFNTILLNSIFVLFPMLLYIFFIAYKNNTELNDKISDCVFELCLFTVLFLIINFIPVGHNKYSFIFLNIPLLFAYIKNKKYLSISLSIFLVVYLYFCLRCNIIFLILEYLSYYFVRVFLNRKSYSIKTFTLIKAFFFSSYVYYINVNINLFNLLTYTFISIIVFYLCSLFYNTILTKAEEIINLNNMIKQLEKEKTLRTALFKLTHEIKNPIAVCKGYLDMFDINNKNKSIKQIGIIKSEIDRTLVIIDDFLDYTKINIKKEIMDINYLLEDTINSMVPLFEKNDLKTSFNISENETFINGDYNRLKQVLVNVLKNAVESCENKKNKKISIDTKIDGNYFKIYISDNGKGMDLEQLKEIGKMFYTTKNNGTGLGVYLSKEIVNLHNGTMNYISSVNNGTTVEIFLPIFEINNCL